MNKRRRSLVARVGAWFMFETTADRTTLPGLTQTHPLLPGQALVPASSLDPVANQINGHESAITSANDLQYACTFELPQPLTCDTAALNDDQACDCYAGDAPFNRALCQPPGGGAAGTTQYYGKAYPGLRQLAVLRGVAGHGIVGSACPKSADLTSQSYGYRPAMDALAGRVARQVGRSCLSTDARAGADGRTACQVVTAATSGSCSCDAALGLSEVDSALVPRVLEKLEQVGYCGGSKPCAELCLCELSQLEGAALAACQTADEAPSDAGFCYLNAVAGEQQAGSVDLASDCVGPAPRRIRFTGGAPGSGSLAVLYCAE